MNNGTFNMGDFMNMNMGKSAEYQYDQSGGSAECGSKSKQKLKKNETKG